MVALGLVFLGLLVVEYSWLTPTEGQEAWLAHAATIIYWIFIADFVLRFTIAPEKLPFLRRNWLTALSLALPALRSLRVLRAFRVLRTLRATRALRSTQLVRLVSGANRGMRALREITRGRQLAYVASLSVIITLLGAGGVLYFDRPLPGAEISSFDQSVWWAATLVTTINGANDPISAEGRVIAILMRIYALSVFGYITASIASYFIGRPMAGTMTTNGGDQRSNESREIRAEVTSLRQEIALLRRELAVANGEEPGRTAANEPPDPPSDPAGERVRP